MRRDDPRPVITITERTWELALDIHELAGIEFNDTSTPAGPGLRKVQIRYSAWRLMHFAGVNMFNPKAIEAAVLRKLSEEQS